MDQSTKNVLSQTLENMPSDWLRLTTHRLDIYNEKLAKTEFLEKFENLKTIQKEELKDLPTAFDYIRLGHPLSCILEWVISKESKHLNIESVISFSSQTMPLLAVLRKNKFLKKKTRIVHSDELPQNFNAEIIKLIYAYDFDLIDAKDFDKNDSFEGSTISINQSALKEADFNLTLYPGYGSIIEVLSNDQEYINEIQHVRRRESIAMTPQNCLSVLMQFLGTEKNNETNIQNSLESLQKTIKEITSSSSNASVGSCGLSVQYAIMMGLIHNAYDLYKEKNIKFIVPPNCYGGTNDQARRVASCIENVEIIDLPVDSGKDMVEELEKILNACAKEDAVPFVIAEIPTNPRVEIPDLEKLRISLKLKRQTEQGNEAIAPVFILDQTFCPNVKFFGENGYLRDAKVISYVSGSKFPSGGLCTAGYAVANESAAHLMTYVENHLALCDNSATAQQIEILNNEMPSMNQRIAAAYNNTRAFVDLIEKELPTAKINFVSDELAKATFTPSVFSLDLPTKGNDSIERESYKRELNHRLIKMMIDTIPQESKHCVSYGQLKGCYWTIPATSTQGTTKESDKDYIVRVSIAADFDLDKHSTVFKEFVVTL